MLSFISHRRQIFESISKFCSLLGNLHCSGLAARLQVSPQCVQGLYKTSEVEKGAKKQLSVLLYLELSGTSSSQLSTPRAATLISHFWVSCYLQPSLVAQIFHSRISTVPTAFTKKITTVTSKILINTHVKRCSAR